MGATTSRGAPRRLQCAHARSTLSSADTGGSGGAGTNSPAAASAALARRPGRGPPPLPGGRRRHGGAGATSPAAGSRGAGAEVLVGVRRRGHRGSAIRRFSDVGSREGNGHESSHVSANLENDDTMKWSIVIWLLVNAANIVEAEIKSFIYTRFDET